MEEPAMSLPEPTARRHPRILLVGGDPARTDGVARVLARDLAGEASVVRVPDVPGTLTGFDAAVVLRSDAARVLDRLADLPAVLVSDHGLPPASATLARMGVHRTLPMACAECGREPNLLALSVRGAIEHGRLMRSLEAERCRERQEALRDPLTGLPNLELYRERLRQLVAQGRRTGKPLAVLFLDLDDFKGVNDTCGHAAGDRLLVDVSRRVAACLRETDLLARRGGDEFVIVLVGVQSPADAARVARKILLRASESCVVQGTVLRTTASIGVAVYPDDGTQEETLERNADMAMYAAKALGGNRICFASGAPRTTGFSPV
jgi:diguanylate cyclase (GGDEF)-like protein